MSLNDITKKIVKDFDKVPPTEKQLEKIFESLDSGHFFIRSIFRDKNNFKRLQYGTIFGGEIDNDKRGWLSNHNFPITLEIMNREKVPGGAVNIQNMGGKEADLLVYHALCPELENFVSLIVWLNSKSSKNAWNQILELISSQKNEKVLQFSEKCGIVLPNTIHPSNDRDSKLVDKTLYESLYDWRFAHYLFDDGKTIMSHNSPLNFRRIVLDEWTRDEAFVGIRSTIGRLISINNNILEISTPCLNEMPKNWKWQISNKIDKSKLKKNDLYFFQIYKITGDEIVETHIRNMKEASPVDILGMFLSQSMYLMYLGKERLKLVTSKQFEKLFLYYYKQVCRFCLKNNDEISSMDRIDWKMIQLGFTNSFTKWINSDLYFMPPILRRFLSNQNFDLETKEAIIQKIDESLQEYKSKCISEIPHNEAGNRMFQRRDIAKINKIYRFVYFLLKSKRLILGIKQNPQHPHQRDFQIDWLLKQI